MRRPDLIARCSGCRRELTPFAGRLYCINAHCPAAVMTSSPGGEEVGPLTLFDKREYAR